MVIPSPPFVRHLIRFFDGNKFVHGQIRVAGTKAFCLLVEQRVMGYASKWRAYPLVILTVYANKSLLWDEYTR